LIYIYIPQDGKSAFDLIPSSKYIYDQRSLKEKDKEWLVQSYTPQEFRDTNTDDITWIQNRSCPMPYHTHDEPAVMQNIESKKIPKFTLHSPILTNPCSKPYVQKKAY
jgi:hypothetical protein